MTPDGRPLIKVRMQTDWFPQAEQGGFYQALARGYYRDEGLDVELIPGGPGAHLKPKVVGGDAEFGMNPATDIIMASNRGLPLVIVGAFLQHEHEALLLHADNPVDRFEKLDGKTVMASPSIAWIQFVQKKYGIHLNLQPVPYGLAQFMADKDAIRQCIITNEPYIAKLQGVAIKTLRLSEAGYDGYHVIFCKQDYAQKHPEVVKAFVAASLKGWKDYIEGDPTPAHRLICARNAEMTEAFLSFSRAQMIRYNLVSGYPSAGEYIGCLSESRIASLIELLADTGVIDGRMPVDRVLFRTGLAVEK